jgi:hypothetical protein
MTLKKHLTCEPFYLHNSSSISYLRQSLFNFLEFHSLYSTNNLKNIDYQQSNMANRNQPFEAMDVNESMILEEEIDENYEPTEEGNSFLIE